MGVYHFKGNDSDMEYLNDTSIQRKIRNKSKEVTVKIKPEAWKRIVQASGLKGEYSEKTVLTAFLQNVLANGYY